MLRTLLLLCLAVRALTAQQGVPPIVFVHGNGDDAAKWMPVIWLFESNGYPREKLYAVRFTNPAARADDTVPEPHRSSTVDQASELSAMVTRVLLETKASKVALVGSSRGGLTIRNYLKNAGGAAVVSHAILCGTPNHGVYRVPNRAGNEFNGSSAFLTKLNEGNETVPGVAFLTIRSDKLDKYAQPDGRPAGMSIAQTGVNYDGPELVGAKNVVLPSLDHREVAFHPNAFAEMYRFVVGKEPSTREVQPEDNVSISGLVTGTVGMASTNLPASKARVQVFALQPGKAEREKAPVYDAVTKDDGAWGPIRVDPKRHYEFVLEREGKTVRYFRSPFLRSSKLVNLRLRAAPPENAAQSPMLVVSRPQGYFSQGRDPLTVDGQAVEQVPAGMPVRDTVMLPIPQEKVTGVKVELRGEVIYARPTTSAEPGLSIAELNWE